MRILVTPRSMTRDGLDAVPELGPLRDRGWELVAGPAGRVPSQEELGTLLPGIDGWIAGVETIGDSALAAADRLRAISRNGVGADAIDTEAASARGIDVLLARGANSRGVAELAVGLMLASLRGIPVANAELHEGRWERRLGRELADCTVGIVGYGAIGRIVGGIVTAFGARVIAFDPISPPAGDDLASSVTFDDLFSQADVVTLHSPPPADGSPLVDRAVLARMPESAILINTARSALVDDDAVLEALETGRVAAYAVDAFDTEPPAPSALLTHVDTITTPHLGGFTGASTRRATEQAVANLIASLEP